MTIFFISDIHLDASNTQVTQLFIDFLGYACDHCQALYILGDLFEMWIGDDNRSEFNLNCMKALKNLTEKGIPVYFMHGNRDFLIGKRFASATGCQLLPDPTCINLSNTPTLLSHGDLYCTADKNYIRYRKLVHNRLLKKLFLWLPLKIRRAIGQRLRQQSQHYTANLDEHIADVTPEAINTALAEHKVERIIHGHTHKPAVNPKRIVLGAWHTGGNVLICKSDQAPELVFFDSISMLTQHEDD